MASIFVLILLLLKNVTHYVFWLANSQKKNLSCIFISQSPYTERTSAFSSVFFGAGYIQSLYGSTVLMLRSSGEQRTQTAPTCAVVVADIFGVLTVLYLKYLRVFLVALTRVKQL